MLIEDVKQYNVVVMDGTYNDVLKHIAMMIDDITGQEFGNVTCRPLDGMHQSIVIMRFKARSRKFKLIQEMIDIRYPALCIFNAPI